MLPYHSRSACSFYRVIANNRICERLMRLCVGWCVCPHLCLCVEMNLSNNRPFIHPRSHPHARCTLHNTAQNKPTSSTHKLHSDHQRTAYQQRITIHHYHHATQRIATCTTTLQHTAGSHASRPVKRNDAQAQKKRNNGVSEEWLQGWMDGAGRGEKLDRGSGMGRRVAYSERCEMTEEGGQAWTVDGCGWLVSRPCSSPASSRLA